MEKLVLIDGHAVLHRAFHALPPLTTSKGELVNAVFGFTSMLLRVISDLRPTHLAVAFDTPKPTFRNKLFKDYQAQRPKTDEDLVPQIDIVHKVVSEMGIPIFEMDGYEADDVIGSLAFQAKNLKLKIKNEKLKIEEIIIVTGDRDILQLVDSHTKVYMPVKGLSESKLYGEKEVEGKFGVKSAQIVDYKALVGDPSDNYSGVPGIGPKTASDLLSRFKTLEQIYKQVNEVGSEKVRKALNENKESAEMAKKLATIVTDVPVEVDLERCKLPDLDKPNVHYLFEKLEFRSLIPRLTSFNRQHLTDNRPQEKRIKMEKDSPIQQTSLF